MYVVFTVKAGEDRDMKITENQKEELLNSPLFKTGKRLTLHPTKNEETWYEKEGFLPTPTKTVVLSECQVIKTENYYFLISSNPYFTGYIGCSGVCQILWVSEKPIELNFTSAGNAANHAYGKIILQK